MCLGDKAGEPIGGIFVTGKLFLPDREGNVSDEDCQERKTRGEGIKHGGSGYSGTKELAFSNEGCWH